jgi:hypothetical protein
MPRMMPRTILTTNDQYTSVLSFLPKYCETNLGAWKCCKTIWNGYDMLATANDPMNVRGTTPGNSL